MNRHFITLFVVLCCFISCETVVDIDVPHGEPKLVVNGFFNPDSTFSISLHQSRFILDGNFDFKTVSGADVILYDKTRNELARLSEEEAGIYEANIKPEAGNMYQIKVSKEGFETVIAEDVVPARPASLAKYEVTSVNESWEQLSLSIWVDDAEGADFYELYAIEKSVIYTDEGDTLTDEDRIYFSSDDPVFAEYMGDSDFPFFDDALFDGEEVKISLTAFVEFVGCNIECKGEGEITLYLRKVSESYYQYKKTTALQNEVEGPFAEPVPVYNNIENGFGIFAGFRTSEYAIEVPDK